MITNRGIDGDDGRHWYETAIGTVIVQAKRSDYKADREWPVWRLDVFVDPDPWNGEKDCFTLPWMEELSSRPGTPYFREVCRQAREIDARIEELMLPHLTEAIL